MLTRPVLRTAHLAALAFAVIAVPACSSTSTSDGRASVPAVVAPVAAGPFDGYVQQVYSTGDFLLGSGTVTYKVVMSPTTQVVNLRGRAVPRQFIRVSGPVQVTGPLSDLQISAQSVLIPTRKDIPDG
jgi:hypothetical protein